MLGIVTGIVAVLVPVGLAMIVVFLLARWWITHAKGSK